MFGQDKRTAMREAFESALAAQQVEDAPEDASPGTEVSADGDEAEVVAEDSTMEESAAEEADDEGQDIEYVTDLLQSLDLTPEQLFSLKVKLSDGQDPVTFGELKDRVQIAENERSTLAEQRQQLEAQQKELQQQAMQISQGGQALNQRMQQAAGRMEAIRQALPTLEEDWKARQQKDPGQVALEKQTLSEQYAAAQQEYAMGEMEARQHNQQAYAQWIEAQKKDLIQKIPKLADQKEMEQMWKNISSFASERYGITQNELQNVDARTIRLLIDAEQGVRAAANAEKAVKSVRARPKIGRGVRLKGSTTSRKQMEELTERARASRSKQDVIAAGRSIIENALRENRG